MRKASEEKKNLARILFMGGENQKSIAEKVGVSKQTINKWVAENSWTEQRAAINVTRPELVSKLLLTIDKLIGQVNDENDPTKIAGIGDKLSKIAAVIEKLDKKANAVDTIEVFMAFAKWLQYRASFDDDVTPELLKVINKYQDIYISESLSKRK